MDYRQLAKDISLIAAIQESHFADAQDALGKGANVNFRDLYDEGKTPLHHAVAVGDKGIVAFLLEIGADPEATSNDGKKPLDMLSNLASKSEIEGIFQKYGCVIAPITPSSAASLPVSTYTKRMGTYFRYEYETKLLALVLFRALHRDAITAFKLASNVDNAGVFDDVVLSYTEGGTNKALYLQAKHTYGKQINLKDMLDGKSEKGNFSILTYFRSYLDLKIAEQNGLAIQEELIIYTNIGVDCALPKGSNVKVQIAEVDQNHLFFTTRKGKNIQLQELLELLKEIATKWYIETLADIFAAQFISSNKEGTLEEYIKDSLAAIDSTKNSLELMRLCNATNPNRGKTRNKNFSKIKNEIVNLLQSGTFPRATLSDVDCCSLVTDFSKKLHLYTEQASHDEVENLLKTEIDRYYPKTYDSNILFHLHHSAVQQWWRQTGIVPYETKESKLFANAIIDMQRKTWLTNLLEISMRKLRMFNVEFSINGIDMQFRVQIENFMNKVGNDVLYVVCTNQLLSCLKLVQYLIFKKYDFNYIHSDMFDMTEFLRNFQTNINCVVLISQRKTDDEIMTCLQKYARKIIIISEDSSKAKSGAINDSNKGLVDLTKKCQREILSREVLFQGMRVSLGALVGDNIESVDEQMLAKLMDAGETHVINVTPVIQEEEKSNYVDRKVSCCALRDEILNDDSFIVLFEKKETARFDNYNKDIIVVAKQDGKRFKSTFQEAQTYFDQICCKYPQRNVHLLQEKEANHYAFDWVDNFVTSKQFLQWIKSQNSLKNIHKYSYVSDTIIELQSLTEVYTNLVIVASEPGMGISTYLTTLTSKTRESNPSVWIIRINLRDFTKTFKEWQEDGVQINEDRAFSFLESAVDAKTLFGEAIFSVQCKIMKKPILLLDEFDEISPDYKETVLSLVNIFRNKFISKIWITTRTGAIQKELELLLNSFAFTLEPFDL